MPKQKTEMTAPRLPDIDPPERVASADTFGYMEVAQEERRVANGIEADYWDQQAEYATELEAMSSYRVGRVRKFIGKLAGKDFRTAEQEDTVTTEGVGYSESKANIKRWAEGQEADSLGRKLEDTREYLRNLSDNQAGIFGQYVGLNLPNFLRYAALDSIEAVAPNEPQKFNTWRDWFANGASNEQLLNLMQWHVHKIESQQTSPEFEADVVREKAEYKTGIEHGVNEGWLHPDALKSIDKVDATKVLVGDELDTVMRGRSGYHIPGMTYVVIQQGAKKILDERNPTEVLHANVRSVLKHELNHAVLQQTSHDRWLKEALTEHIALVMNNHRELDEIGANVFSSSQEGGYVEERNLLDVLARAGLHKVPIELFTRDYSRNRNASSNPDSEETTASLDAALEEAWGHSNVLGTIQEKLADYETMHLALHGGTGREAQEAALRTITFDLLQQPHIVFGGAKRQSKPVLVH